MQSYVYTYFDWFGASGSLPSGYGLDYTLSDVMHINYIPQPDTSASYYTSDMEYITFTEYIPNGWIGYCQYEGCSGDKGQGETPVAIQLGYDYSTYYNYFVFFATSDVWYAGETDFFMEDGVVTEVQ
jgi:hypothetical protein